MKTVTIDRPLSIFLSKLNYDFSDDLKTQVGLDYRYARIYHVKTIRDLLGGDYYMTSDSEFDVDNGQGGLGDPITIILQIM